MKGTLGYTIAAVLKRTSRCFFVDKMCFKTDWLEQLNHRYVQMQGSTNQNSPPPYLPYLSSSYPSLSISHMASFLLSYSTKPILYTLIKPIPYYHIFSLFEPFHTHFATPHSSSTIQSLFNYPIPFHMHTVYAHFPQCISSPIPPCTYPCSPRVYSFPISVSLFS